MSDADIPDLTTKQEALVNTLPAHIADIADALGIARSTVRDHIDAIRDSGLELTYDRKTEQWTLTDERASKVRRISTKHKSTITREANEVIEAEHSYLLNRLERTDPLTVSQNPPQDAESFCIAFGDTHFGDVVETDRGRIQYDMDIAADSVDTFAKKVLRMKQLEGEHLDFSDCHLFLLGDLATGTHIYSGQVHDIQAYLAKQVEVSAQKMIDLIVTLNNAFDTVHVYGVLGNHGQDRAGAARGSNTDLLTYRWVQDGLRRMDVQNVEVTIADNSHSLTTQVRNQTVHVRHGQQGQQHVDKTARSESDWRGIWSNIRYPTPDDVGFDVALRGHYHCPSMDWLMNTYPVFTAPSPKPGGEFAEMIGSPDVGAVRHLGWCFGIGNSRRVTFKRLVDDGDFA